MRNRFSLKSLPVIILLLVVASAGYSQETENFNSKLSLVWGIEAFSIGLRAEFSWEYYNLLYGGFVIIGLAPVSGALGGLIGYQNGYFTSRLNFSFTGWMSERVGDTTSAGYFSLNPYIGLRGLSEVESGIGIRYIFIYAGPSFFFPPRFKENPLHIKFLGTLWNLEAGVAMDTQTDGEE